MSAFFSALLGSILGSILTHLFHLKIRREDTAQLVTSEFTRRTQIIREVAFVIEDDTFQGGSVEEKFGPNVADRLEELGLWFNECAYLYNHGKLDKQRIEASGLLPELRRFRRVMVQKDLRRLKEDWPQLLDMDPGGFK